MRLTRRAFLMAGVSLALAGCGGGSGDAKTDEAESVEDAEPEQIEQDNATQDVAKEPETLDFDGTGLEEVGDFEFFIASSGGTSENGNVPIIAWAPDRYGDLVSVNVYGGDGTVCVVYVDGHERNKINAGDCNVPVDYDPQDGTEGTHLVELVSYSDNGATIYRKASYEVIY